MSSSTWKNDMGEQDIGIYRSVMALWRKTKLLPAYYHVIQIILYECKPETAFAAAFWPSIHERLLEQPERNELWGLAYWVCIEIGWPVEYVTDGFLELCGEFGGGRAISAGTIRSNLIRKRDALAQASLT